MAYLINNPDLLNVEDPSVIAMLDPSYYPRYNLVSRQPQSGIILPLAHRQASPSVSVGLFRTTLEIPVREDPFAYDENLRA